MIRHRNSRDCASSLVVCFSELGCTVLKNIYLFVLVIFESFVFAGLGTHQIELLHFFDGFGQRFVVLSHLSQHFVHTVILVVFFHDCVYRLEWKL